MLSSNFCSLTFSVISFAASSLGIAYKVSPAEGIESKPRTSIGIPGVACFTFSPLSLSKALTFPKAGPQVKWFPSVNVPLFIIIVATGPLPVSIFDSTTMASANLSCSTFKFKISTCNKMLSSSLSRLIFFKADISVSKTSP